MNNSCLCSIAKPQFIVWALLCLMPIIGMAVDLIAPSLPAIATSLHVSSSMAKNVITTYLLGYALGNFFTGFLTDALGRRTLLRLALLGFTLVSLAIAWFPTMLALLLGRFLQGMMMGAISVLLRAILADILIPEKLVKLGPIISAMWGIGPIIGPVIGGYLQFYLGWQWCFYFFAASGFLGFSIILIVPETHFKRQSLNFTTIIHNLRTVLAHQTFIAMVLLMGLTYSLLIVFNTVAPFLIQTQFHYSSLFFGRLALLMGVTFLMATLVCRYLLQRYPLKLLLYNAIRGFLVVALIDVVISYRFANSITLVTLASGLMFFASGIIFPIAMGNGLSLFRHIAGTAAATMYLINILTTTIIAFLISLTALHSAVLLMWIYLGLTVSLWRGVLEISYTPIKLPCEDLVIFTIF